MTPSEQSVPYGFCHCGCGQKTNIRTYTIKTKNMFKGEPALYIHGHPRRPCHPIGPLYIIEDRDYNTPCWIWQRGTDKDGYAIARNGKGSRKVHRQYFERKFGPIPIGHVPDHLCLQKGCINPDHLEAVTMAENARRRQTTRLTTAKAAQIRASVGLITPTQLAIRYGVTISTIRDILKGRRWAA